MTLRSFLLLFLALPLTAAEERAPVIAVQALGPVKA